MLGEGKLSSGNPWARNCANAAAAVSRVYCSVVRKVGSCWLWESANAHSACATSGCCSSQNRFPPKAACAPRQMIPVRCSCKPSCTVSRPHPNTRSAWRALPSHYFSAIAAWNARRSPPDSIELANLRSSIWEAGNGKAVDSIADGMVVLSDQPARNILPQWGNYFSEMTLMICMDFLRTEVVSP